MSGAQDRLATAREVKKKETYFTAGQYQLIWSRFRKNRSALIAGLILLFFILTGVFAEFVAPYAPSKVGYDPSYLNGPPQLPRFWDENGFSMRPFVFTYTQRRDENFHLIFELHKELEQRRYLEFFVEGWDYQLIDTYVDLPGKRLDFLCPK